MRQRFETSQWVPYPVDLVFAFFADPNNLPLLMPENSGVRIEKLRLVPPPPEPATAERRVEQKGVTAGAGTEMEISFRPVPFLPLRTGWVARITEFAWLSHFCDEQVKGPFEFFRHCHRVRAEIREGRAGTVVTDEVEFSLPMGWLGRLANGVVLRQMRGMFQTRQERLPRILESRLRETV